MNELSDILITRNEFYGISVSGTGNHTAIPHLRRRSHPAAVNMSAPVVAILSGLPSASISLAWTVRQKWLLHLGNISKKEYYEEARGDDVFDIEFYRLPNGTAPVEEFLDSLNVKMRSKAIYSLSILEEQGNRLREPFSKSLGDALLNCVSSLPVTLPAYSISLLWTIK